MAHSNDPFRFRLATLLIGTAMVAFVVYATAQPSVWAASFGFTVAVVVLSLALIRAMVAGGGHRRYWLAFALVAMAYLVALYAPSLDERVGARLLPTIGFAQLEGLLLEDQKRLHSQHAYRVSEQRSLAKSIVDAQLTGQLRAHVTIGSSSLLPQETWGGIAFHSMFAIVLGLVAGWVAMLPQRGEMKGDTPPRGVVE